MDLNIISLIVACLSALAASVASIATFLAWKENRELRKAQTDPFIDIKLENVNHHINLFRLKITNIGKGGAFNIKVSLGAEPNLNSEAINACERVIERFNNSRFMLEGINYLEPIGSKYTKYFNLYSKDVIDIESFGQVILIAKLEYTDLNNKVFHRDFVIDFSEFRDTYSVGEIFEESVPKALNNIQKYLKEISDSFKENNDLLEEELAERREEWSEYDLKIKLNYMQLQRERHKRLGLKTIDHHNLNSKRKISIHELRKKNK